MEYNVEQLMFNSYHFEKNNTNNKISTLFYKLIIEYLLTQLIIHTMLINQIRKQSISVIEL